ncbi:outer membrane protein assembly factor BamE [Actinobacillus porcinus]|uniref:outer membrane protein assembly factor BamE domain-containing protein n=1 Tax=Actinobacillus porcinus TaxID=51048 RepID=UPI0023EFE1C5|nr:outer membrane protein assembly factor BamE [Actinobacillus porcinus]MDD7544018.1 outer membrane protein assembly factor BamE [Actinobacillus porcinus]MDY5848641.1 outer membrane protein assembly factor BamE [Actinobacillus porcinus]
MKRIFCTLVFLSGCTSSSYIPVNIPHQNKPIHDYEKAINDISIGMSKNKVISILGQPLSTEAEINKECLTYPLTTSNKERFVLLFNNGKLVKYNKEQNCLEIFK